MLINTVRDLDKILAEGPYVWPGGYPLYFLTADGGALSFEAVAEHRDLVADAIAERDNTGGWRVIAAEVNWEDHELVCDHTGEPIPTAYGEE